MKVIPVSCSVIPFLKDRCLVGTLVDWTGEVSNAKELASWCSYTWGITSVEVKDMNGSMYMFILPSRAEARIIHNGCWNFKGVRLELNLWEDRSGCFVDKQRPEALWVRILGLPISLWSEDLFRALGDRYGGYMAMTEETLHRNHAKWARICVRGTGTAIPASLMIGMGSLVYACPIWVESSARVVRRSEPTRYSDGNR